MVLKFGCPRTRLGRFAAIRGIEIPVGEGEKQRAVVHHIRDQQAIVADETQPVRRRHGEGGGVGDLRREVALPQDEVRLLQPLMREGCGETQHAAVPAIGDVEVALRVHQHVSRQAQRRRRDVIRVAIAVAQAAIEIRLPDHDIRAGAGSQAAIVFEAQHAIVEVVRHVQMRRIPGGVDRDNHLPRRSFHL